MRYRLTDAFAVLRTPIGRSQVLSGMYHRAWPIMSRLENLYRRHAARDPRRPELVRRIPGLGAVAASGSTCSNRFSRVASYKSGSRQQSLRRALLAVWRRPDLAVSYIYPMQELTPDPTLARGRLGNRSALQCQHRRRLNQQPRQGPPIQWVDT